MESCHFNHTRTSCYFFNVSMSLSHVHICFQTHPVLKPFYFLGRFEAVAKDFCLTWFWAMLFSSSQILASSFIIISTVLLHMILGPLFLLQIRPQNSSTNVNSSKHITNPFSHIFFMVSVIIGFCLQLLQGSSLDTLIGQYVSKILFKQLIKVSNGVIYLPCYSTI